MHVAIDIDGTLTDHPKELLFLMDSITDDHIGRVTILTGSIGPGDCAFRKAQVRGLLGDNRYDHCIVICEGATTDEVARKKGEFCRDQHVDMIFEDTPSYLQAVRQISPNTACWLNFK